MSIAQALLAELEQESQTTRRFLERLPADMLAWKPHEKSMSAGQLALHIAQSPGSVAQMASVDTFEMPDFSRSNPQPASVAEVLEAYDESLATARRILPTFPDAAIQAEWRLVDKDGKLLTTFTRAALLRMIMLNHVYHHRGQFGVYLRLLGANVPSSYGPSGDEPPAFLR